MSRFWIKAGVNVAFRFAICPHQGKMIGVSKGEATWHAN